MERTPQQIIEDSDRTSKRIVDDTDLATREVVEYLCSQTITMPLERKVQAETRRVFHALAMKGWKVTRKKRGW